MPNAAQTVPFMAFWKALNDTMSDRGQPQVLLGEARRLWDCATDQARVDREQAFQRKLKRLAA